MCFISKKEWIKILLLFLVMKIELQLWKMQEDRRSYVKSESKEEYTNCFFEKK